MSIYKKLAEIQAEIKVPKGQYNSFGKYNYRSCEDILEAAKPLLSKQGCVLTITDQVEHVEGRFYVKAEAQMTDAETTESFTVSAYAREEESKKGMDGAQVTGSTSSYARKYALNGLFALDDVKDSDATNKHGKDDVPKKDGKKQEKSESWQVARNELIKLAKDSGIEGKMPGIIKEKYGASKTDEMTEEQLQDCIRYVAQEAFANA